jgi:hypothetical protein
MTEREVTKIVSKFQKDYVFRQNQSFIVLVSGRTQYSGSFLKSANFDGDVWTYELAKKESEIKVFRGDEYQSSLFYHYFEKLTGKRVSIYGVADRFKQKQ